MIVKPQLDEMLRTAWDRVSAATGLSNDSESGVAYNIMKAFCQEVSNLWDQLEYADTQSNLSTALGTNLDKIGEFFGVVRRSAMASTTLGTTSTVTFTNNGGAPVTIPSGTRVWPTDAQDRAYFTTASILITAGSQLSVDVTAADKGVYYNVGANSLTNHSLYDVNITVNNEVPITTGRDVESDGNFRVRIAREILRKEGANLTAVREALMDVPGVRDAILLNMARGTGTIDAIIYGYDREVSADVISNCQQVMDQEVAAGVSAIARAPILRAVDLDIRIKIKSSAVFAQVRSLVSQAVRGYADNLPIASGDNDGTLVYQELAARVQEASTDIIDSTVTMSVDGIPLLKSNFIPALGERVVSRVITIS